MRLILLHNPAAGEDRYGREALEAPLEAAGHDVVYRDVKKQRWKDALHEEADIIVVAGGDGTVEKVLTALGPSSTTAAIIPTGSANNIANAIGVTMDDPESVIAGWDTADHRRFDVWQIDGTWGQSRFLEAFGGGVFANMFKRAGARRDEPSGEEKHDRGLQLLRSELEHVDPEPWQLEIDGRQVSEQFLGVEMMNVSHLGPQLELARDADPGDGVLDVVLLRPGDREDLIAHLNAHLAGGAGPISGLEVLRGSRIVAATRAGSRLHVDDEFPAERGGQSEQRAEVRLADVAVELLVPPPG